MLRIRIIIFCWILAHLIAALTVAVPAIPHHSFIRFLSLPFALALDIRGFLSVFKAWAIIQGEADERDEKGRIRYKARRVFLWAWNESFFSNGGHKNVDDHWLPFLIGLFELYVYPFLMGIGQWKGIGFWIGIKVASQLGNWQRSRTPFNRFLLGNLLGLLSSRILFMLGVVTSKNIEAFLSFAKSYLS